MTHGAGASVEIDISNFQDGVGFVRVIHGCFQVLESKVPVGPREQQMKSFGVPSPRKRNPSGMMNQRIVHSIPGPTQLPAVIANQFR